MVQSSPETEVAAESGVHYPRGVNTGSFHITFHHVLHSERMNIDWCCSKECEGCRADFIFSPCSFGQSQACGFTPASAPAAAPHRTLAQRRSF